MYWFIWKKWREQVYHKDDIYKENRATVFESYTVDSKSVSITTGE